MNGNEAHIKSDQSKKVDELHAQCKNWKSKLRFVDDEISFIDKLLNSYVFEPNTPNLFERLQGYLERIKKCKEEKAILSQKITTHENTLGGMLECTDNACDQTFYQKHNLLKAEVVSQMESFQNLKSEIFNYAGSILKKRKPKKNN